MSPSLEDLAYLLLNKFLKNRSYFEGYEPSQKDADVFNRLGKAPPAKFFHLFRWYNQIRSLSNQLEPLYGDKCQRIITDLESAATSRNIEDLSSAYILATVFLMKPVHIPNVDRLLRVMSISPLQYFEEAPMEIAAESWCYILDARPDLELVLLKEILLAWKTTVQQKMGLFSLDVPEDNPLAADEDSILEPRPPNVAAHDIWIFFFRERIALAKYTSQYCMESFANMLHDCLSLDIGRQNHISRHPAACGTRFELLYCGLCLLQRDDLPKSVDRNNLREKIYQTCLDYFAGPLKCPTQKEQKLLGDRATLIRFWQTITLDKKHIQASFAGETETDGSINTMNLPGGSTISFRHVRRKRLLILFLLAVEIDRFSTWHNPLGLVENQLSDVHDEQTVLEWIQNQYSMKEEHWKKIIKICWDISPSLTVFLPSRLRNKEVATKEVECLVQLNPDLVAHIPEALDFLVTASSINKDIPQLSHLLHWKHVSPVKALSYFSRQYPQHQKTAEYAVRCLNSYPPDAVLFYIPQLVQAIRNDKESHLQEYVKTLARRSQLAAHQLIWNMDVNKFKDKEGRRRDPVLYDILDGIVSSIIEGFSDADRECYTQEFAFVEAITSISEKITKFPKGEERKTACNKFLQKIDVPKYCYLPCSPEAIVLDIDNTSGKPLQSAAKAPFLANFKVVRRGIKKVENVAIPNGQISRSCNEYVQAVIFKAGDDVRQDMLAVQIISLFKKIFQKAGLDLFLFPYRVVATAPGNGVIELVPKAMSRDSLGKIDSLYEYFLSKYGDETTQKYQHAQRNFIRSMAAYSIVCYLLQIKDRNNGNIMIDEDGHVIHIDFGFMFESSPGKNMGLEPDIKLTEEMLKIMGGKEDAPNFRLFLKLCVQGFLAVRPYHEAIISLVSLMLDSGLPCFRRQTVEKLRARFRPQMTDREAADSMIEVVSKSCLSSRTYFYDACQWLWNRIPY